MGGLYSGIFDLPWWGYALAALALTHVTIVAVTVYLHRHKTHHALDLHPAASHFFRFWLWLTTGMVTREWVAVHRKHHAHVDAPGDPHSPRIFGVNRVLWGGVFLYVKEARNPETLERYGHGTPDDALERRLYSRYAWLGPVLAGAIDVALFGVVPGALVFATQILWIPFWAAGVINGIGHAWGYRHWPTPDASTNIAPWGILIGGEELHNNHHAFPTSAKLSYAPYEIDIGWLHIRLLQAAGLARVRHVAPIPHFTPPRPAVDPQVLDAVVTNRYDVLARYAESLRRTFAEEIDKLRRTAPAEARALQAMEPWLERDEKMLRDTERERLAQALPALPAVERMYAMRRELAAVWARSTATGEQLVAQLQDWCRRAESSGIRPLAEFSARLRSYS